LQVKFSINLCYSKSKLLIIGALICAPLSAYTLTGCPNGTSPVQPLSTTNSSGVLVANGCLSTTTGFLSFPSYVSLPDNYHAINVKSPTFGATGNGSTDDTAAFQAASNAVATNGGGLIYVPVGTYYIATSFTIPSNTVLYCEGGANLTSDNVSTRGIVTNSDHTSGNINIRVTGCTFTRTVPSYTTFNEMVYCDKCTNFQVDHTINYGAATRSPSGLEAGQKHIHCEACITAKVTDNWFQNASDNFITISWSGIQDPTIGYSIVSRNHFLITGDWLVSAVLPSADHVIISDNEYKQPNATTGGGRSNFIELGDDSNDIIITGNYVLNAAPLFGQLGSNILFENNISDCNTAVGTCGQNIGINAVTANVSNIIVANNLIKRGSIQFLTSGSNLVTNITITGNTIYNTDKNRVASISVNGFGTQTNNIIIKGNTIASSSNTGISMVSVNSGEVSGNTITLAGSNNDGSSNGRLDGMYIGADKNIVIQNNNSYNNPEYGYLIESGLNNTFINNTGSGNSTNLYHLKNPTTTGSTPVTLLKLSNAGAPTGTDYYAGPGSTYTDTTNGQSWIKLTGFTNTGWRLLTEYQSTVPATSSDACTPPLEAVDNTNHLLYVCTTGNVWQRVTLSAF
jgi:hypothetical protein